MKKIEITEEDIINWWLSEFHNTNLEEVKEAHPQWAKNPQKHTRAFYEKYSITEEQYKEFEIYFYKTLPKKLGITQKYWRKGSWIIFFNTAPTKKNEKKIGF